MVKPQCRHVETKLTPEWTLSLVFLNNSSQFLKRIASNRLMYLIACNSIYTGVQYFHKKVTSQKRKLSIKNLVTFTEEILNEKFYSLCSALSKCLRDAFLKSQNFKGIHVCIIT